MATVRNLLGDLVNVEGITSAVVIGRDGFVIEGLASNGMDTDALGAVVSTGLGSAEVIGRELGTGMMSQALYEYKDGVIMMSTVGRDAILAVVADLQANLGNIRYQVKKVRPNLEAVL